MRPFGLSSFDAWRSKSEYTSSYVHWRFMLAWKVWLSVVLSIYSFASFSSTLASSVLTASLFSTSGLPFSAFSTFLSFLSFNLSFYLFAASYLA